MSAKRDTTTNEGARGFDPPRFEELPEVADTGERHAWGVFGDDDQVGTMNLLTPERVRHAAGLVRRGALFNLSLPLDLPNPPLSPQRKPYEHEKWYIRPTSRDDKLDSFHLQASSQWDALGHVRFRRHGFYNGLQNEDVDGGALGIERWAQRGIVGRGVLADVPRYLERQGTPFSPTEDTPFDHELLAAVLGAQGVTTQRGDILLLRTGWMAAYLSSSPDERAAYGGALSLESGPGSIGAPGLKASREMAAFLWDSGFAAVVADNPAVENAPGSAEVGNLHRRVIPLLGLAFGELWDLEGLAADCSEDGVYEFLLVSIPLNLPGGVGSPANAIAVK